MRSIGAVPPPTIEGFLDVKNSTDFEASIVRVQITLRWSMSELVAIDDEVDESDDSDTPILLPSPSPSPVIGTRTGRSAGSPRQQRDTLGSSGSGAGLGSGSGSGSGSGASGDGDLVVELGDLTGVRCYVGREALDLFDSPNPERVFDFEVSGLYV